MEVVLDASTALAWMMPDEGLEEPATRLVRASQRWEVRLCAPSLFPYEVANGLRRAARVGRVSPSTAWHTLQDILSLEIAFFSHEEAISRGWWLTRSHGISLYDASYLGLAEQLGCQCLTADQRLANAAADTGLVRWIGDYGR